MAKRELSSTLRNLKFMQRAREKEESTKKNEEEHKVIAPIIGNKKCVVVMEGDPTPGAVSGRMSFQNFNPSIDKLNDVYKETPEGRLSYSTGSADRDGRDSSRENEESVYGNDNLNKNEENDDSEHLIRKKQKVDEDAQGSYSSPKNSVGHNVSQSSLDRGKNNQQERARLDWRLLRPPTGRTKRS